MATLTTDTLTQPQARPHADRIRFDMDEVRKELTDVVSELTPDVLSRPPAEGIRTPKGLLQEIGTMETLSRQCAMEAETPSWDAVWAELDTDSPEEMMAHLSRIRADTLARLDSSTEEQLETPIELPVHWREYFGNATHIEPEELLRWIVRHEYYHLGQLYTYSLLRAAGK